MSTTSAPTRRWRRSPGLESLPKASSLGSYSYRLRRSHDEALLTGLARAMTKTGQSQGADFDLDFHAIMHFGDDVALETHYVPRRSQRTESVLSFFAHDGQTRNLVYANAACTKADQASEVIAFARHWQHATGHPPELLVFDSKVTTGAGLAELHAADLRFITLRARTAKLTAHAGSAAQQRLDADHARAPRPPRKARDPRTRRHRPRLPDAAAPDRRPRPRPRAPHPDPHQRPRQPAEEDRRPLRPTDAHRATPRRIDPQLPPRRTQLRGRAQRRPRHHPDRLGRRRIRPPPPTPPRLRGRHPRHDLATLHQHQRPAHDRPPTTSPAASTAAPTAPSCAAPTSPTPRSHGGTDARYASNSPDPTAPHDRATRCRFAVWESELTASLRWGACALQPASRGTNGAASPFCARSICSRVVADTGAAESLAGGALVLANVERVTGASDPST